MVYVTVQCDHEIYHQQFPAGATLLEVDWLSVYLQEGGFVQNWAIYNSCPLVQSGGRDTVSGREWRDAASGRERGEMQRVGESGEMQRVI